MAKEKHNYSYLENYENNISIQKTEIEKKIRNMEQKLISLNNKESIINTLISKINMELENVDPKHFKAISQIRTTLNKQFETLSLIIEMIIKIEDSIQKYRKMLIDIENQKINNFIKLTSEQEEAADDINKVLFQINNQFNEIKNLKSNDNPLLSDAIKELQEEGVITDTDEL